MLYLGIDQHKAQLTINLRNEQGDVIRQGQIRTDHAEVDDFFSTLKKQSAKSRGFMAILEVCGFNHWLIKKLEEFGCKEIVLMPPAAVGRCTPVGAAAPFLITRSRCSLESVSGTT